MDNEYSFLQAEDDIPAQEGNDIEENQLNEDIKEEEDASYIKMDWSLETAEERVEKVKEIIVDSLSCDESQVTMEANLKDDLEADSLDAVELIMQIEEEFEVEIPDEVASNMKTVKDIVDYIEANK